MTQSVTMIHTVSTLVPVFGGLGKELLPDVDVFHVVDESLLTITRRVGALTPATRRRLLGYATAADDLSVDAILVTCSSIGPVVDQVRPFLRAPILRVDGAMADAAVREGRRIGVLATLTSTLEPTRDLIAERARPVGADVTIRAVVADGALEAVVSGDVARHDALVRDALLDLAGTSDVIVLAQASIARVLDGLGSERPSIPVLSSPRLAVERLSAVLGGEPVSA
jgi:Asp/Glu/hydantoin racemase